MSLLIKQTAPSSLKNRLSVSFISMMMTLPIILSSCNNSAPKGGEEPIPYEKQKTETGAPGTIGPDGEIVNGGGAGGAGTGGTGGTGGPVGGNSGAVTPGVVVPTEETYGLSVNDFEKGRAYVNAWAGLTDDVPVGHPWFLASLPDVAVLPPTSPITPGTGTGAKVSYDVEIKPLLDRSCTTCHAPGLQRAQDPMNTYETAKTYGLAVVDRASKGTMPPTGGIQLSEPERKLFESWRDGGFLRSAVAVVPPTGGNVIPPTGGTVVTPPTGGTVTPPTGSNPQVEETATEVIFHIRAGTGSGAWNTAETMVTAKVGKKFTIVNDDTVTHQWHTNGSPCQHGSPISAGQRETCNPDGAYTTGGLYDHISRGAFFIQAQ